LHHCYFPGYKTGLVSKERFERCETVRRTLEDKKYLMQNIVKKMSEWQEIFRHKNVIYSSRESKRYIYNLYDILYAADYNVLSTKYMQFFAACLTCCNLIRYL